MSQHLSSESPLAGQNRRISTRYQFSAEVEIEWFGKRLWGRVRNISREGMFIELHEELILNATFSGNLALNSPLRVECVVRRIEARSGVGVTITIPEAAARKRFDALLFALSQDDRPAAAGVPVPVGDEPRRVRAASAR